MFTGISQIKSTTKESVTSKPFNQTTGEEWTDEPINFSLSEIFTELHYQMKYRKTSDTMYKDLDNIFTLFKDDSMKRLLIEGKDKHSPLTQIFSTNCL